MKIFFTVISVLQSSTIGLTMTIGNQTISQNTRLNSSFADSVKSSIENLIVSALNGNSNTVVVSSLPMTYSPLAQAGFGYAKQVSVPNHVHALASGYEMNNGGSYNPYGYYYHNKPFYYSQNINYFPTNTV